MQGITEVVKFLSGQGRARGPTNLAQLITGCSDIPSVDQDDTENRKLLDLIATGKCMDAMDLVPEYAAKTGADMQFKSYYWLMGAMGSGRVKGKVLGYGSIWGSGAAVVEFTI